MRRIPGLLFPTLTAREYVHGRPLGRQGGGRRGGGRGRRRRSASPVDFSITDEQRGFRQTVRDGATATLAPGAAERDRDGRWDPEIWKSLAANGLAGLPIPEEYGGGGAAIIHCRPANQAIAEGGPHGGLNPSPGAPWGVGAGAHWLPRPQGRKRGH